MADGSEAVAAPAARAEASPERLEPGGFRALLDERLREAIARAAAEPGLADEIGALRVVLARLLTEEEDVTKLASSVARVASVVVQAARTQRALSEEAAEGATETLTAILAELDEA